MLDKAELERYKSFILGETDDGLFLFARDRELRRPFILSTDSSRSKLVAIPKKGLFQKAVHL